MRALCAVNAVMDFIAGRRSERIGRKRVLFWGWVVALLYPNLSAAMADVTPPAWRGSAIGIYRFWRDLGYAIGALGLGLAASRTGAAEAAFWFVVISMFVSCAVLFWLGEETHPRLKPAASKEAK